MDLSRETGRAALYVVFTLEEIWGVLPPNTYMIP